MRIIAMTTIVERELTVIMMMDTVHMDASLATWVICARKVNITDG